MEPTLKEKKDNINKKGGLGGRLCLGGRLFWNMDFKI